MEKHLKNHSNKAIALSIIIENIQEEGYNGLIKNSKYYIKINTGVNSE